MVWPAPTRLEKLREAEEDFWSSEESSARLCEIFRNLPAINRLTTLATWSPSMPRGNKLDVSEQLSIMQKRKALTNAMEKVEFNPRYHYLLGPSWDVVVRIGAKIKMIYAAAEKVSLSLEHLSLPPIKTSNMPGFFNFVTCFDLNLINLPDWHDCEGFSLNALLRSMPNLITMSIIGDNTRRASMTTMPIDWPTSMKSLSLHNLSIPTNSLLSPPLCRRATPSSRWGTSTSALFTLCRQLGLPLRRMSFLGLSRSPCIWRTNISVYSSSGYRVL